MSWEMEKIWFRATLQMGYNRMIGLSNWENESCHRQNPFITNMGLHMNIYPRENPLYLLTTNFVYSSSCSLLVDTLPVYSLFFGRHLQPPICHLWPWCNLHPSSGSLACEVRGRNGGPLPSCLDGNHLIQHSWHFQAPVISRTARWKHYPVKATIFGIICAKAVIVIFLNTFFVKG